MPVACGTMKPREHGSCVSLWTDTIASLSTATAWPQVALQHGLYALNHASSRHRAAPFHARHRRSPRGGVRAMTLPGMGWSRARLLPRNVHPLALGIGRKERFDVQFLHRDVLWPPERRDRREHARDPSVQVQLEGQ